MSPINNNDRKNYQTVLEEQAPLVCDDSVENKSLNTRPAMLLSIGFALFAVVATAGHLSRVSSRVSNLEAAIAAHQSQLQAVALRDTSLLGSAFAPGSLGLHERCDGHGDCASGQCKARGYAQCEAKLPSTRDSKCSQNDQCASGFCNYGKRHCDDRLPFGKYCDNDNYCASGFCDIYACGSSSRLSVN